MSCLSKLCRETDTGFPIDSMSKQKEEKEQKQEMPADLVQEVNAADNLALRLAMLGCALHL